MCCVIFMLNRVRQHAMQFSVADWCMLQITLCSHLQAVRLHSCQPLHGVNHNSTPKGIFFRELITGDVPLPFDSIVLATLLGFPCDETECATSVKTFRSHVEYRSFLRRILAAHIREHTQIKSAEHCHKPRETEQLHVERLFHLFDQSLRWIECESCSSTEANELMSEVFDLKTPCAQETVFPFRKQFMMELFRAVCNFIMRYLFANETTSFNRGLPKKLYVTILPLCVTSEKQQLFIRSAARSSVVRSVSLTKSPSLWLGVPIATTAWNLVHRGTSELIPLILNLFGFENHCETTLVRLNRDEVEISSSLQSIFKDFHVWLDSSKKSLPSLTAEGNADAVLSTTHRPLHFLSITLPDILLWQSQTCGDFHSSHSNVHPWKFGDSFFHLSQSILQDSVESWKATPMSFDIVSVSDASWCTFVAGPAVCRDLIEQGSTDALREYQRAHGVVVQQICNDNTFLNCEGLLLVLAANINRVAKNVVSVPKDIVDMFERALVAVANHPEFESWRSSVAFQDLEEILHAALHVSKSGGLWQVPSTVMDSFFTLPQVRAAPRPPRKLKVSRAWTTKSPLLTTLFRDYDGGLSLEAHVRSSRATDDAQRTLTNAWNGRLRKYMVGSSG